MKQNERWLVYAVTGFLAVILVIAVVFHEEPANAGSAGKAADTARLDDIFGEGKTAPGEAGKTATGLPTPGDLTTDPPLVATPKPMLAADLVAQQLGVSRRDRTVRFVRVRSGDSLDSLVRRWCAGRDGALDEAKCLNEDLGVLRVGGEVAVPWVEDDEVLAALEAKKPKTLLAQDASANGTNGANGASGTVPAVGEQPPLTRGDDSGAVLGANAGTAANRGAASAVKTTRSYTVKAGDSLWRIADRTYGRKNAERMVRAIQDANPGLGDALKPGQRLVLPADGE